jgi:trans-2,3-dihydro-3-hydroxyanthranilate isomerase
MTQRTPEFGGSEDVAAVAGGIGLPEDMIRATGLPVQRVSCGVPFVMVPISTRAAVDSAEPDTRALHALARTSGVEHFSLYVFTTDRSGATDEATAYARMFAPGLGVYEDPATGSACGPLGSYLVRHSIVTASEAGGILILQGRKLGRPSWIHVAIESTGGAISRVRVGGTAVFVAEGLFELEAASLEEVPA